MPTIHVSSKQKEQIDSLLVKLVTESKKPYKYREVLSCIIERGIADIEKHGFIPPEKINEDGN